MTVDEVVLTSVPLKEQRIGNLVAQLLLLGILNGYAN